MLEAYRTSSIEWKPSPILSLATSSDGSQVAAAREDGSLEIWIVSPGSMGWHCLVTIHGDAGSRVSSIVWCRVGLRDRLLSSSIDGSVSEWDLFNLRKKTVLDSVGVSIWQMAVAPSKIQSFHVGKKWQRVDDDDDLLDNPESSLEDETDESDDDSDFVKQSSFDDARLALACDDGCVRMYEISESEDLVYIKSLPRVSGRILSVTWNPDASVIYSGSSDGLIRCWDAASSREIYRITIGLGGHGSGPELCIWSLLSMRSDTLVSADSTGAVQFWDSKHGTLLQAHSFHKGDVNTLAAAPSHDRVFSAGSDGQVVLYKLCTEAAGSSDGKNSNKELKKWVYVGYVRAHTHDVRSLTVAVPVVREDSSANEKPKRIRRRKKPVDFTFHKWAHIGIPMLLSSGDDMKIFAYSVKDFSKFSPHDICPAPQRLPIQLVLTGVEQNCLLLVQSTYWLDILCVHTKCSDYHITGPVPAGGKASTRLLARVKSKASRKVICSSISASGEHFAYSDCTKPSLFELKRSKGTKNAWTVNKRLLPSKLPPANCMIFSVDSSCLIIAGCNRRIYVVDITSLKVLQTYTPCHEGQEEGVSPDELPITKMFASSDGQWLAAVNCYGDVFLFDLKIQRQHWFISRLNGASITAGGFSPHKNNMLVLTTSSNHVYVFDVVTKELGEWSKHKEFMMPRRFQEFPGEVIGLSFPPSPSSSSVVIYSSRALCLVDFGTPVDQENDSSLLSGQDLALRKLHSPVFGKLKFCDITCETEAKANHRRNFDFFAFRDPVLFIGHLSKNSIIIVDKPWREVVKTLEAPPVHRHIFGS